MQEAPQRKYALTMIRSGDYLFPSNNGKQLWRAYRYDEDGSLEDGLGGFVRGSFWAVAYFDGAMEQADRLPQSDPDEFLSWVHWYGWETHLPTRNAAIKSALRKETVAGKRPH